MKTALGDILSYTYEPTGQDVKPTEHAYFQGYRRTDGKAGVRNEIWIIPTVGCVNSIAKALEAAAKPLIRGNWRTLSPLTIPTDVPRWETTRRTPARFWRT